MHVYIIEGCGETFIFLVEIQFCFYFLNFYNKLLSNFIFLQEKKADDST